MTTQELFSLGELYVSDFLKDDEEPRCPPVEMKLLYDNSTGLVRLEKPADPDFMYGRYWYRSGINQSMKDELKGIVQSITKLKPVTEDVLWLDIACNDGTLLSYVPSAGVRIGIDPVDDSFKEEAEKHADRIVQDYFSADAFWSGSANKADIVTCIAMFYDLDDPKPFLDDVYSIMENDGLFVLQMSYTPLMLQQIAFDNICHEHIYYYTLSTLQDVLAKSGFKVMDVQLNDVNGGSFRVYAMKDVGDETTFGTQPFRDVCRMRVDSLQDHEDCEHYNSTGKWAQFSHNIEELKSETVAFIKQAKAEGKSIWGYGASTKGNTLLQYFGLDNTLIDGIAERSEFKYGLRTIGTNIPIYSEEYMRRMKPDYLLVLPWHFISEFVRREQDFLKAGGQFIVPCPKFKVIGA